MSPSTRKTISVVCLVFAIAWFVLIGLLETHYVRGLLRHQSTLHDILGTIYEEQIEGINFVVLIVFLIPGVFAWAVHRRVPGPKCSEAARYGVQPRGVTTRAPRAGTRAST